MTTKKEKGKPSFIHCKKEGHDEENYWKLHLEFKQRYLVEKGSKRMLLWWNKALVPILVVRCKLQLLEYNVKVPFMLIQALQHASSNFENESHVDEWKRSELFHIRVLSKHTKIDTLFDPGSQVSLISQSIVKNFVLMMIFTIIYWCSIDYTYCLTTL